METSKADDSFQHELEDYIRKQRARGLQPDTCFRKVAKECVPGERGCVSPQHPHLEQQPPFRRPPASCGRPRMVHSQAPPPRPATQRSRPGQGPVLHWPIDHQGLWLPGHSLYRKDRSRFHWLGHGDRGQRRWHQEEPTELGKRHLAVGEAHAENRSLGRQKAQARPRKRGPDATAGRRACGEKGPGSGCPEDRDLWDVAILGSCH